MQWFEIDSPWPGVVMVGEIVSDAASVHTPPVSSRASIYVNLLHFIAWEISIISLFQNISIIINSSVYMFNCLLIVCLWQGRSMLAKCLLFLLKLFSPGRGAAAVRASGSTSGAGLMVFSFHCCFSYVGFSPWYPLTWCNNYVIFGWNFGIISSHFMMG